MGRKQSSSSLRGSVVHLVSPNSDKEAKKESNLKLVTSKANSFLTQKVSTQVDEQAARMTLRSGSLLSVFSTASEIRQAKSMTAAASSVRRVEGTLRTGPADGAEQYHRAGTVVYSLLPPHACSVLALFFPGDNVEGAHSSTVDHFSRPETISRLLRTLFGADSTSTVLVYPSHYQGPFACFENLFPPSNGVESQGSFRGPGTMSRLTASGEPLGYRPQGLPAATSLVGLLQKVWGEAFRGETAGGGREAEGAEEGSEGECSWDVPRTQVAICGFSKGGVVMNQLFAELAEFGARNYEEEQEHQANQRQERKNEEVQGCSTVLANSPSQACEARESNAPLFHEVKNADSMSNGQSGQQGPAWQGCRGSPSDTVEGSAPSGAPQQEQKTTIPCAASVNMSSPSGAPRHSESDRRRAPGAPMDFTSVAAFLGSVSQLHYIDVGLQCRGAYPTDPETVSNFVRFASKTVIGGGDSTGRGESSEGREAAEGRVPAEKRMSAEKRVSAVDRESAEISMPAEAGGRKPAQDRVPGGETGSCTGVSRIVLHGTPRQWADRRRQWIAQEKNAFVSLLQKSGASIRAWTAEQEHKPKEHGPKDHGPKEHGPKDHGPKMHEPKEHGPFSLVLERNDGHDGSAVSAAGGEAGADAVSDTGHEGKATLRVDVVHYFKGEKPSMDMHFRILGELRLPS